MTNANTVDDSELLVQLQNQKGRLSRLIGTAKKNKEDAAQLIAEMQQVSAQIKQLQKALKETPQQDQEKGSTTQKANSGSGGKPAHFAAALSIENNQPDHSYRIVTIENTETDSRWPQCWNKYVEGNSRCSVYHRFEFRHIITQSFQQTPHYHVALDQNDQIVGILPAVQMKSRLFGNFIVSMPYFNYGGPIADSPAIEELLIQGLIQNSQQLGIEHIELRESSPRKNYAARTDKAAMILALPLSEAALWQQIGSKIRAQIKKAKSYGLTIQIGQQELLDDFYQVFAENMRDLGTPVYSKQFFLNIFQSINTNIQPSTPTANMTSFDAQLVIVYDNNGKPVSGGFLINNNDTVEIPWASTLRSANKLNANMFLYWHVLSHCTNQKIKFFDFGRSSKEAGTFKFKKQWGAQPQQLYWHYWLPENAALPAITTNNPKYELAIKLWQRLPVWITKIIGPGIVKNIP